MGRLRANTGFQQTAFNA
jgi:hypothetical protein